MTNTAKRQARPATAKTIPSIERHYPGADVTTAQLVNKLKHRGITDPRAAVRRPSSALIEDAYRDAQEGQAPKLFDNNYSPYSNVNAEAAEQAARRQAEARRRAESERLRQNGGAPAIRRQAEAPAGKRPAARSVPAKRPETSAAARRPASSLQAARPNQRRGNSQLAESGPREVAVKRVPFPMFAIVLIFIFVVLFFMVQSIVKNYEYKREIADLQRQVEELGDRAELLRSQLENRIGVDELKDRAEGIGMIKNGQSGEKYIDLSGGDIIEHFGDKDGDLGSFTTMLSAIRQRISGLLGGE